MATIIGKLDQEYWNSIHDLCLGMYLDGECYAFATALHEGLGWQLVGLMDGTRVRHAAVESHDKKLFDARGFVVKKRFGERFGMTPPYLIRHITVQNLKRAGESDRARDESVKRARKFAELLWPELPWKNSLASRAKTFSEELEELCRKHGFWIRASVPSFKPILYESYGDEEGFALSPTVNMGGFTIERRLGDNT